MNALCFLENSRDVNFFFFQYRVRLLLQGCPVFVYRTGQGVQRSCQHATDSTFFHDHRLTIVLVFLCRALKTSILAHTFLGTTLFLDVLAQRRQRRHNEFLHLNLLKNDLFFFGALVACAYSLVH